MVDTEMTDVQVAVTRDSNPGKAKMGGRDDSV